MRASATLRHAVQPMTFLIPPDSFESPYGAPAACSVGCALSQQFLQSAWCILQLAACSRNVTWWWLRNKCGSFGVAERIWRRRHKAVDECETEMESWKSGTETNYRHDTLFCIATVCLCSFLTLLATTTSFLVSLQRLGHRLFPHRVHVSYRIYSTSYENDQRSPSGAQVIKSWSYTSTARKLPTILA